MVISSLCFVGFYFVFSSHSAAGDVFPDARVSRLSLTAHLDSLIFPISPKTFQYVEKCST